MSTDHFGGNLQNEIIREEHDGVNNAKRVSVITSVLPTGAATASNQTTTNTLLGGIAGLLPTAYDYISYTSGSTTDTYVFKTGGSGGSTIATIVISYTDSTKSVMTNTTKT